MKLIVANWKTYLTAKQSEALAKFLLAKTPKPKKDVVICPSFLALNGVKEVIKKTSYVLGAQNIGPENNGPYTGEILARDLKEMGVKYAIVGHSERRHKLGETNEVVLQKFEAALHAKLQPILCVGETRAERMAGKSFSVIKNQLQTVLNRLPITDYRLPITIAYEPVWAIGTGIAATVNDAIKMHKFIRETVKKFISANIKVKIIYGGSVELKNADDFFEQEEVDGVLIGGASAKNSFSQFLK